MRRVLCVWLPGWPTLRLKRNGSAAPDLPLATVETLGMRRLAAVCPLAEAAGLREGMPLAQARAICPHVELAEADPRADRDGLAALAVWAERYTPLAVADPPDGVLLDIAGCAHLWGSEAGLAGDLHARLLRTGLPARIAVAGTAGCAWALARAAPDAVTVLPAGQERAALADAPIALLRLDTRVVAGLRRLGVRRVAELARLARGEVSARFGGQPVLRLDQAFGAADEPIVWPHPPAPWHERQAFAEPIATPEDFSRALVLLAKRLCARLAAAGQGARRFTAGFLRADGVRPAIAAATALPVRDPAYVAKLLAAKLETVEPGFGIDAMWLEADGVAPLAPPQTRLGDLAAPAAEALAATVDALANRLGPERLWRPMPHPSHVPERSVRRAPPLAPIPAAPPDGPPRPLRLLARPEPIEATAPVPDDPPILFRWRGAVHRVRAASGPERIAAEWWRGQGEGTREPADLVRDYYRVEDSAGARFWLFRTGRHAGAPGTGWFLHGLFG
jgi:protein ImuB